MTVQQMKSEFRVLNDIPADARLYCDRTTETVYTMPTFASAEEVDRRREELRFNLRMSAGLYPWPEKTPLNVKREPVGEFDGYTIEKIMIETYPGLWTTGNLYFPRPMPKKAPAILNVIGHWWDQRLTRSDEGDYPQQIANFARMGFICLVVDMIGMVDNMQLDHYYGKNSKPNDMWLSCSLGVQLWNNIRALDYLCSIPEVDTENIGLTGASGGGTQTFVLTLVDDRIKAAAPINMVSAHYAGGCSCENSPGLRRHTNNVEITSMAAPRALFLAGSTGDWTKNLETVEAPDIASVYKHYKMENMPEHFFQVAPHQYNAKTRHHVYSFFARHLMGKDPAWQEQEIVTDNLQDLTWFKGNGHAEGFNNDEEFFRFHKAERTAAYARTSEEEKLSMLRWVTGIQKPAEAKHSLVSYTKADNILLEKGILSGTNGEQLPYIRMTPDNWDGRSICLALSESGKAIADSDAVQKKLSEGIAIVSADLFLTGEFEGAEITIPGDEVCHDTIYSFHYPADALRAQDIALLWNAIHTDGTECTILADGCAARAAACALPLLPDVKTAALEKAALAIDGDAEYAEKCYIPGILAVGGLEGCLALAKCPVERF